MQKTPSELTIEWHERVWNLREESAIYELMDETCLISGLILDGPGPAGFIKFHRQYFQLWEDIRIEIIEMLENGDLAIGHANVTGIHKSTGNKINAVFSFSVRWKNGKAIEARNIVDYTTLLFQMGAMDPEVMIKAFTPPPISR